MPFFIYFCTYRLDIWQVESANNSEQRLFLCNDLDLHLRSQGSKKFKKHIFFSECKCVTPIGLVFGMHVECTVLHSMYYFRTDKLSFIFLFTFVQRNVRQSADLVSQKRTIG